MRVVRPEGGARRGSSLEARASLIAMRSVTPVALPERLAEPRWWALAREPNGVRHLPLEPGEGALLTLLGRYAVREALARLEAACAESERAELPAATQRWLARSVERGIWEGLTTEPVG